VPPDLDLERYIADLVDEAPPLSAEQKDRLALILRQAPEREGGGPRAA